MLFIQPAKRSKRSSPCYPELLFKNIELPDTLEIRNFIKYIDHGEYKDSTHFYDYFNKEQSISHLSKGSKTGILAYLYPDRIFDTTGCGINAECLMIAILKQGHLIIREYMSYISNVTGIDKIGVYMNGYRFFSFASLSDYFSYGYPSTPVEGLFETIIPWPDEKLSRSEMKYLEEMRYLAGI